MFFDEIERIGNRVQAGTKRKGYTVQYEDDYSDESTADSICADIVDRQDGSLETDLDLLRRRT